MQRMCLPAKDCACQACRLNVRLRKPHAGSLFALQITFQTGAPRAVHAAQLLPSPHTVTRGTQRGAGDGAPCIRRQRWQWGPAVHGGLLSLLALPALLTLRHAATPEAPGAARIKLPGVPAIVGCTATDWMDVIPSVSIGATGAMGAELQPLG